MSDDPNIKKVKENFPCENILGLTVSAARRERASLPTTPMKSAVFWAFTMGGTTGPRWWWARIPAAPAIC